MILFGVYESWNGSAIRILVVIICLSVALVIVSSLAICFMIGKKATRV